MNSLYNRFNPGNGMQQNRQTGNGLMDMFGNFQNFQQQFNQFAQNFRQMNQDPQQMVQGLLNSGRMTQEQFDQFSQIANMITGQKK